MRAAAQLGDELTSLSRELSAGRQQLEVFLADGTDMRTQLVRELQAKVDDLRSEAAALTRQLTDTQRQARRPAA